MANKILTREEVAAEYKWRLEDIYPTVQDWETEFAEAEAALPAVEALKETLVSSAQALAEGLDLFYEINHKLERLYIYARMKRDQDNADSIAQALTDRANGLCVRFSAASSFVNPLLLTLDESTLEAYLKECDGLKVYEFYLKDLLRSKQHILSEKEEKLLSMAGDFAGGAKDIFTMLNNADLEFGEIEHNGEKLPLSHGSYLVMMQDGDRELRKKAYETFYGEFKSHINTIAAAYATSVKKDVFYSRARGYADSRARALFSDNVSAEIYDKLIADVHENLPILYKYIDVRKKALGVDELHMYDIYAPLAEDVEAKYSYEEAVEIVLNALKPLGEEYCAVLKEAFSGGWVDVYETKGKTTGAYSWGVYGTHPYVLLNHRGDLDSVFTIAHEMGHAMHTYLSNKTQPYPLADYTIFVAEIASTVNEILTTKYLLKTVEDPKLRKYILNHYIDQFRTTVLRQTMFAEFEKISHEMAENNEPLTPQTLSDAYEKLNALYHGEQMVSDDDTIRYEWARIPHFYNAFYVYKYATGLSTAVAIVDGLDQPGNLEKYLGFLSMGGSKYPLDIIASAGVDFNTVVGKCMKEFARALEEFEKLV